VTKLTPQLTSQVTKLNMSDFSRKKAEYLNGVKLLDILGKYSSTR